MSIIDTEALSLKFRQKAIDIDHKLLSITNYTGSEQEKDLTEPANCNGFGRIRHFKLKPATDWPLNPLPIIPAVKYLGISEIDVLRAQVFQNSVCNWRCWYCYVDFKLLNGDSRFSEYLSCNDLLDLYEKEPNPPLLIDLSGGQPDLTPEWVPWMMEALTQRGLQDKIFLWSDDNLSNDFFWRYLTPTQIDLITSYKMYARVCCFKGIDERSFSINTKADPALFSRQFDLFKRLWDLGIDLYAYITLPAPVSTDFDKAIPAFLDRIQAINEKFPLRIVPLKIFEFGPSKSRHEVDKEDLMAGQLKAIEVWQTEIEKRFTPEERSLPIYDMHSFSKE
jgi:uncharacterized Fe-S cluster-containing radical SAM superfamily protein